MSNPVQTHTTKAPRPPENAARLERSYPGTADQAAQVRADLAPVLDGCPFADDLVLMASELSANAILHSRSRGPSGEFRVRAEVRPGEYAWLEVEDQGGPWRDRRPGDEHGRGVTIVEALAGDGNWGIERGDSPDTRVVWVRLDWPDRDNG